MSMFMQMFATSWTELIALAEKKCAIKQYW